MEYSLHNSDLLLEVYKEDDPPIVFQVSTKVQALTILCLANDIKQETHTYGPIQSPEYQRLYTNFLSEGLIFASQQAEQNNSKLTMAEECFILTT